MSNKINRRQLLSLAAVAGTGMVMSPGIVWGATSVTRAEQNEYALRTGPLQSPYVPQRGYADGPFGQVHFRDTGKGIPLVLCHQSPHTSKQFTNVYEPLQQLGIRAIGVDTPGFGESDPVPFVPTIEDWASTVPAVLDHLGIEQAHVLGHHTGAMVAAEVALQYPDRVKKLILNGPMPMGAEQRKMLLKMNEEREIGFVYEDDGSHLQKSFQTRYKMYGEGADSRTITRYTAEKFQGYTPFWIGHHAAFIYDFSAALMKIECPTLILTNTGDSIYKNVQVARELRPDFAYTELEGGGVDIVDQMPKQWSEAVAAFLNS